MGGGQSNGGSDEKTVHRLLLLGAGEAGKSTIFKQIMISRKGGFSVQDRAKFSRLMQHKVLEWVKVLVGEQTERDANSFADVADAVKEVEAMQPDSLGSDELRIAHFGGGSHDEKDAVVKLLASLSKVAGHPKLQEAFEVTNNVSDESVKHLMGKATKVCSLDFKPEEDDILRFRSPTTDIAEIDYIPEENENVIFRFIDIGGQRKERLKWNTVGDVTAVVFVVAMDEYNKSLVEDTSRNRMKESILLFRMITTKHFADKPIILFLNKKDLFLKKIQTVSIKCCFPEYVPRVKDRSTGKPMFHDYQDSAEYIEKEFRKVAGAERQETAKVYTHRTCATETDQMQVVFKAVEKIILDINIESNF